MPLPKNTFCNVLIYPNQVLNAKPVVFGQNAEPVVFGQTAEVRRTTPLTPS
jgi:hypothetical protein